MTIYVENDFAHSEKDAVNILSREYSEILECLTDNTGTISVIKQETFCNKKVGKPLQIGIPKRVIS